MLNFIYYPISAVLWFWHKVFGFILDPDLGVTWALSIIFLVVTIRIILVKPVANQLRSSRRMQEFQPKMKELQRKYGNDQQKLMQEMRAAQKEMGVNPLASCLPMLIQMPLFLGLFHVLRSFNRTGTGLGQPGMSIEETRNTPNYVFSVEEVQSFLDSRLFGAPLSGYISMDESGYGAFSPEGIAPDFTKMNIILVVVPLMLAAAVIMHFTARLGLSRSQKRQSQKKATSSGGDDKGQQMQAQMQMMQRLMLWFMPLMILAGGFLWQVGLALYMFTNGLWTLIQQNVLYAKMDREEEEKLQAKREAQKSSAPKPGVKPKNAKRRGGKGDTQASDGGVATLPDTDSGTEIKPSKSDGQPQSGAPKPGAKPNNNKKKRKKKKK